ncbi:MAG: tRNA1(Val) (adenine(37)-N6)-methyltransferase [Ruminococcus flavefaciens]|nr:tRNA1(Val) (adenine(37)-N6)-methyltransferase [Ruminococcus flavefaciens]
MKAEEYVKDSERLDDLMRNGYKIIQNPDKFCFGMDAVLLTSFVSLKKGDIVLDLGTGTGVIPILLSAKSGAAHFDALEIQSESVNMANRSVQLNQLEKKITIKQGDIKEASLLFSPDSYDAITCNPPYMIDRHGLKNPDTPKAIARHEILCTFDDVARESAKLLKGKGRLYLVHRPFRLVELFATLTKYHLEPKRMRLVYPYIDREPNMVLIEAVKDGGSMIKQEAPLIIYRESGVYTDEVIALYEG